MAVKTVQVAVETGAAGWAAWEGPAAWEGLSVAAEANRAEVCRAVVSEEVGTAGVRCIWPRSRESPCRFDIYSTQILICHPRKDCC